MKLLWYKDITEKDKQKKEQLEKERLAALLSAQTAFKVLTGILESKIETINKKRNSAENYKLPAFAEMQADASGYLRALEEVKGLIDFQEE